MREVEDPKAPRISVVMPIRNGAYTVRKTLESLLAQTVSPDELIIVDDSSDDESVRIVKDILDERDRAYVFVEHQESKGLAHSYNDGIRRSTGQLVVTLHCDVVLQGETALERLVEPLRENENVVMAYHFVDHPLEVWETYGFWQKCFFARQAGRRQSGMDGKFDCFRKSALEKVGLFDGETFFRAGEDGDMFRKLARYGAIVKADAGILHLHDLDPNFNMANIVHKHAQYAESQGAIFRRYGLASVKECVRVFFREIMVLVLFIPGIRVVGLLCVAVYSVAYCGILFAKEWRNVRILLVPFLNVFLLFVSCVFSARGFIQGRQAL